MQPISDDMLTSKICVAVVKCEQALIQGQSLMGDGPLSLTLSKTITGWISVTDWISITGWISVTGWISLRVNRPFHVTNHHQLGFFLVWCWITSSLHVIVLTMVEFSKNPYPFFTKWNDRNFENQKILNCDWLFFVLRIHFLNHNDQPEPQPYLFVFYSMDLKVTEHLFSSELQKNICQTQQRESIHTAIWSN